MTVGDEPLHVSEPTWKSLGRRYKVYRDRVDIPTWFGHYVIRAEDLEEVDISPGLVIAEAFRKHDLSEIWAVKPDLADLCVHVSIKRRGGLFKRIHVSPEDPVAFAEACRVIMGQN